MLIIFDSSNCENNFRKCINLIDLDNYFFDIYGFIGLDIDSNVHLIKLKYEEFKNKLVCKNNLNNVFSIFLELIGFSDNKKILILI